MNPPASLYKSIFKPLNIGLLYFLIMGIAYVLPGKKLVPPFGVTAVQVLLVITNIYALCACRHLNKRKLLSLIFILNVILSIVVRTFYIQYWGNPLGPVAVDSRNYHLDAIRFSKYSFPDFIRVFLNEQGVDDFGFTLILRMVYVFFGAEDGQQIIIFFNSLAMLGTSICTYKLARKILSREDTNYVTCLAGLSPYNIVVAAKGLKENFFTFIVLLAIYNLVCFSRKRLFSSFLYFCIFSILTLFFRIAEVPILAFSFIAIWITPMIKFKPSHVFLLFTTLLIELIVGRRVISMLLVARGLSENAFSDMYESQYSDSGMGGMLSSVVNVIFGLIGSIPSFVSTPEKVKYITLPNFSSYVSMIMGALFLFGIFRAFKNREKFSPMLVFALLNILMIVAMSFSFDFRYRSIFFPLILITCAYGYETMSKSKMSEYRLHKYYLFFIICFIIFFNR